MHRRAKGVRGRVCFAAALAAVLIAGCGPGSPAGGGSPPASAPDESRREPVATAGEIDRPMLAEHNRHRARHCAPPLRWSGELERAAGAWAAELERRDCALEHGRSPHGENLAAASAGALRPDAVVGMWYQEVKSYDFERPGFSFDTGHFTQLVWLASRELGCASRRCGDLDVWVCRYAPPGNVEDAFAENVLPTTCRVTEP